MAFHLVAIGPELRRIREASGVTQAVVAGKAGLKGSYLSKIELGYVDPGFGTVQDVTRALDHEILLIPKSLVGKIRSMLLPSSEAERPMVTLEPDWDDA